jgi:hypothetical protein
VFGAARARSILLLDNKRLGAALASERVPSPHPPLPLPPEGSTDARMFGLLRGGARLYTRAEPRRMIRWRRA